MPAPSQDAAVHTNIAQRQQISCCVRRKVLASYRPRAGLALNLLLNPGRQVAPISVPCRRPQHLMIDLIYDPTVTNVPDPADSSVGELATHHSSQTAGRELYTAHCLW